LDSPAAITDVVASADVGKTPRLSLCHAGGTQAGGRDARAARAVDFEPIGDQLLLATPIVGQAASRNR
jgi:hypothetical protein